LLGGSVVELVGQAVAAAAALDVDVVVAANPQLRDGLLDAGLPSGVRVVVDLPLHLLLPGCVAVVHHGGAGTTMTAAGLGLPQLVVAGRPEPAVNGTRLAACGAGRALLGAEVPAGAAGADLFRAELRRLLDDPAYRAAA